jgi:DNA end-binding protein Ku
MKLASDAFAKHCKGTHMTARPSWDGYLRLSLISVPVKAYTAASKNASKVGFNLLHKTCHNRIRYQKVCPVHGEVDAREIVSGYEYAKGKYVVVDDAEKSGLKLDNDKSIEIEGFIAESKVDPLYYSGRSYYLLPNGAPAKRPYAVLEEVMRDQELFGVAETVLYGREHLAMVRSLDGLLVLSLMSYLADVKSPDEFRDELTAPKISAEERRLARTLIDASTRDDLDLSRFEDDSAVRLQKLIGAKVKSKRTVEASSQEEPKVINLMDALKKSLSRARPVQPALRQTRARPSKRKPGKARRIG